MEASPRLGPIANSCQNPTVRLDEWVVAAATELESAGIESARLEARLLAGHALGRDRAWTLAHGEAPIDEDALRPLLTRRLSREPLAYIVGYREFFGRRFAVDRRVLIPRPETETVVEAALEAIRKGGHRKVLDLCTGSGCIGITLALDQPGLEVWASDLSAGALEVARSNAEALEAKVRFVESDLFRNLAGERFDLIVSNPPYVRSDAPLAPEVGAWEPAAALFAGENGLEVYARIAQEAPPHLSGPLILEVGDRQAPAVREVCDGEGWKFVDQKLDLLGHERALTLKLRRTHTF